MAALKPKFAFVLSTSGSVMQRVLETGTVLNATHSVIAEQDGPMLEKARAHGLHTSVISAPTNEAFCEKVLDHVREFEIDYILSFYTKFYSDTIRTALKDRIINFHPSLLPAFKGMDGFGDGLAYHTKIIGTTVELIKDVMDEGKIVMQTACAVDTRATREEMRDRIFVQQCKTLIQVVEWIVQGRIEVDGDKVSVRNARFRDPEFSPALENAEATALASTLFPAGLKSVTA
jgi:phosphoribosylglycinamide formyltransferase-1